MKTAAVIPGTFDPVTKGHLDIFSRAGKIFDQIYVVVTHNPNKTPLLAVEDRMRLIEQAAEQAGNCRITKVDRLDSGLLVDYCRRAGARIIVRGLRTTTDTAYEVPMAHANRNMAGVETVFLLPDPALSIVSSSLVRQLITLGGDFSSYVPPAVQEFFAAAN